MGSEPEDHPEPVDLVTALGWTHVPKVSRDDELSVREAVAGVLARLRSTTPRVHCLTNTVAEAFTANVLLAAGAFPAVTATVMETPEFLLGADSLLVNLGTLAQDRRDAIAAALPAAEERGIPWVLDPAFVDRAPSRLFFARSLLEKHSPSAVRANEVELAALLMAASSSLAGDPPPTIVMTGQTDVIRAPDRRVRVRNGHRLMAQVTATGCALSALVAACLAVEGDRLTAALAAVGSFGVAADVAGASAKGPGSFAAELLDALHLLAPGEIADRLKLD